MEVSRRIVLFATLALVAFTGAYATPAGGLPAGVPLPADVRVVPPSPEIPKELAAWSGRWVGVWDNILDHVLVVEEVNRTNARVTYAFGTAPQWGINQPNWFRISGEFVGDSLLRLTLRGGITATYTMTGDRLNAVYAGPGVCSTALMVRVKE